MTEIHKPKRALRQFTSEEFSLQARAIGETALAWNDLQERLGELFAAILMPQPWGLSFALWHSLKSDRAQRDMLQAAIRWRIENGAVFGRPKLASDILKFLGQVSSFEIERNDVIHSPLESQGYTGLTAAMLADWAVLPSLSQDNPRALSLENRVRAQKGLLKQLHLSRDTSMALADHAYLLMKAVCDPNEPWPHKLQLPNRGEKRATPNHQPHD